MSIKIKAGALHIVLYMLVVCVAGMGNMYAAGSESDITVHHSDTDYISLSYYPHVDRIDTVSIDGNTYILPKINNTYFDFSNYGAPIESKRAIAITVPSPSAFSIESYEVVSINMLQGTVAPVPTAIFDNTASEQYIINEKKFINHTASEWIKVAYSGVSASRHIAHIILAASVYDAGNHNISIPERIDVVVRFNAKPGMIKRYTADRGDLPLTINHAETKGWRIDRSAERLLSNSQNLNDLSNGSWWRLKIPSEGIYKITAAELSAAGCNVPKDKIGTVKIFGASGMPLSERVTDGNKNLMNEQDIIVKTNADGSLESVIFYASGPSGLVRWKSPNYKAPTHYLNDMDNNNYYLITYGGSEGKRAAPMPNPEAEAQYKPVYYMASLYHEKDNLMPSEQFGGGRIWFDTQILGSKVDILHDLVRDKEDILYFVSLAHKSPTTQTFTIYQNKDKLGNVKLTAASENARMSQQYFSYPSSGIGSDNRSTLNFEYSSTTSTPYFDFYEVHYPRSFVPVDNEITFFTDTLDSGITEYTINGFTSEIYGFDVTDMSNPKLLTNKATTGSFFTFKSDNTDYTKKYKRFFVASKMNTPAIESITLSNLRGRNDNADVIVITNQLLKESAEKYAKYRSAQSNLNTIVVTLEEIYNEFSHSRTDLTAIRDYVQYCYNNWNIAPEYVVLWGLGHFDYRGISYKATNFIPAYERYSSIDNILAGNEVSYFIEMVGREVLLSDGQSCFATDDHYSCIDGDDLFPDIAIGRIPIASNKQGEDYIAKLNSYENHSDNSNWRNNIVLFADDPWKEGAFEGSSYHHGDAESVASTIPDDFYKTKIYGVAYPVVRSAGARRMPKATEELLTATNVNGGSVLFFTGHGNPRLLTHEQVFNRDETINMFTNDNKLFYFMASSCEVGRFDMTGSTNCIGTEIVRVPKVGAIASLTATRVSSIQSNNIFFMGVFRNLFNRDEMGNYISIGENSMLAKSRIYYSTEPSAEAQMYVLLGDPTLRLVYPNSLVKLESINDEPVTEETNTIKAQALSKLHIKGSINDSKTGSLMENFNGSVIITLNEANFDANIIGEGNYTHTFVQNGATLTKSAFPVKNGMFSAEFVIPGDISFSDKNAVLYLYAFSEDSIYAKGSCNKLFIDGISAQISNDGNGPDIDIYLDSKDFRAGDLVSKKPMLLVQLEDETGINATGLGIGHKIEAWIDDNPNPVDLTHRFNFSLEKSTAGTVTQRLTDLQPGQHKIKIRAWDVFNNHSIAESYFTIPGDNDEQIISVDLYPNPANQGEEQNIIIKFNINPPVVCELAIFDAAGNEVQMLPEAGNIQILTNTMYSIPLNLVANRQLMSSGSYYYRIRYSFNGNKTTNEKFGILGTILN